MTNINNTVVGIQVSDNLPVDGYVITYIASDNAYKARPSIGLRKDYFTSSGTWICPIGVNNIILIGCGGGGAGGSGGAAGYIGVGGGGGGGAIQSTTLVSVVPGTTYSITIGDGGTGQNDAFGHDGYDTTFSNLATFCGASGGGRYTPNVGGIAVKMDIYSAANPNNWQQQVSQGGSGASTSINSQVGARNPLGGFIGGNVGTDSGTFGGGGGGAAGPQGNGGDGSNANNMGTGIDGSDASPNTGAGGGGSGSCSSGTNAGGNGGSGYLYIVY